MGLNYNERLSASEQEVRSLCNRVANLLGISASQAELLLLFEHWDVDKLIDQ